MKLFNQVLVGVITLAVISAVLGSQGTVNIFNGLNRLLNRAIIVGSGRK